MINQHIVDELTSWKLGDRLSKRLRALINADALGWAVAEYHGDEPGNDDYIVPVIAGCDLRLTVLPGGAVMGIITNEDEVAVGVIGPITLITSIGPDGESADILKHPSRQWPGEEVLNA